MRGHIEELLERIRALQDELEEEYRKARDDWFQQKTGTARASP